MNRNFTAIVHEASEGGFWATCAEVPEANGQGETLDEVVDDLREAIALVLEAKQERGVEPLVEPTRLLKVELADAGTP